MFHYNNLILNKISWILLLNAKTYIIYLKWLLWSNGQVHFGI